MTMNNNWNWQQMVVPGSKQLNLPDFDMQVLLVEKRKDRYYGQIGSLTDINSRIESTSRNKYGGTNTYPDFTI